MNERDFLYWLNGFLELSGSVTLNEKQVRIIKEHIALVMTKVTPSSVGSPTNDSWPAGHYVSGKDWMIPPNTFDQCDKCKKPCSEAGGMCRKCMETTNTSQTSLTIPIFPSGTVFVCRRPRDEGDDGTGHFCSECEVYLPIHNVKTHLSC